jgi:hypothetical protein
METKMTMQANIYIIIPVLEYNSQELDKFLYNNQFLLKIPKVKILIKTTKQAAISNEYIINVHQPDSSIYQAWNQSISELISFEHKYNFYAIFCGLDDVLMENFFTKAQAFMSAKPDIIFGNIEVLVDNNIKFLKSNPYSSMLKNSEKKKWDIFHPGMFMNGRLFQQFSFDENYQLAADFKFFVEVSNRLDFTNQYIGETQALINLNGISNKPNARSTYLRELEKIASECDVEIVGFNTLLEIIKMKILSSWCGDYIRRIYWALK